MRSLFVIIGIVISSDCAVAEVGDARAAGRYSALGLESQRNLDLREDGTFLMVLRVRGSDLVEKKTEERGSWKLEGDVVTLLPANSQKYDPRILKDSRLLLRCYGARRKLLVGVPGVWGYDKVGLDEVDETQGEQATTGNAGKESLPSAKPEARRP